jgi:hypothetical protein
MLYRHAYPQIFNSRGEGVGELRARIELETPAR